ncbi:MAG: hypothetical protein DRQ61_01415 [Gammaproteobacteria bacterium]|nr:MAG: hypothetical protein DRQ56_00395 [Gammaproteobacteria bacterium]RLA24276.1 MAG: hypothetical protein DRQ61_01415 [Gammaproteobacteria bacterium]
MKKLNTLLNASPNGLKPILFKISENNRVTFYLKKQLPDFIASHCNQCTIREKQLTILVDSAIWVSQLRFYTPTLLETINRQLPYHFNSIKIRVLPNILASRPTPVDSKTVPSKAVIELLQESAEHFEENDLKHSLQRLSNTLKSLS